MIKSPHVRELIDVNDLSWNPQEHCMVEIGSERGQGSTLWFAQQAKELDVPFYSVDINEEAKTKYSGPPVDWQTTDLGSYWCRDILPLMGRKIKILYLDNMDWNAGRPAVFNLDRWKMIADPNWPDCKSWEDFYRLPMKIQTECQLIHKLSVPSNIYYWSDLKKQYRKNNVDLNNRSCVQEHFDQMFYALPMMAEECIVACDDTFISEEFDIWTGKCSAVVPLLIQHGFVLHKQTHLSVSFIRKSRGKNV